MRILLGTHLLLWALTGDSQLGVATGKLILDPSNVIYVSAASIWEAAIKHRKHPQVVPIAPDVLIDACKAHVVIASLRCDRLGRHLTTRHGRAPVLYGVATFRAMAPEVMRSGIRCVERDFEEAGCGSGSECGRSGKLDAHDHGG